MNPVAFGLPGPAGVTRLVRHTSPTRAGNSLFLPPGKWCLALALAAGLTCLPAASAAVVEDVRLDRALAQLEAYDWGQPADGLRVLDEAIAATRNDSATRRALERRLVAILQTNAPVAARQLVCRQLSLVGSRDAVPALASLLAQEELSHMARFALERIPDAAAASALRAALPKTRGRLKAGLINSLGTIADAAAVPPLAPLLGDADSAVAVAATIALGKIGTREAMRALEAFRPNAPEALRAVVNDASVIGAGNLARRGERAEAIRIFREFYEHETGLLRLAGFRGLVQAEPDRANPLLTQALAGNDEPLRRLTVRILTDLPGEEALEPFLDSWPSLPVTGQLALLEVVHRRGDSRARATVRSACESRDSAVRLAAWRALGVIGTPADVARLARLTTADDDAEREAARLALAALPGRESTQAIVAMLPTATPPLRSELIRSLIARGATDFVAPIVPHLQAADASTRQAALDAIAALGDEREVPAVIALLKTTPDDAARAGAAKTLAALVTRTGPASLEALLAGVAEAKPAARLILLEQLGAVGGSRALAAVRAALGSNEAGLAEGAFRVLAAWPDWEAAPDLVNLARQSDRTAHRALAFRGYVRLCRETPAPVADRLARLTEAARLAADTNEQMLVISALADVPDAGALKLLAGFLDDAALAETAGVAIVKVTSTLDARDKDAVAPILQRTLRVSRNAEVRQRARDLLKKLGAPSE